MNLVGARVTPALYRPGPTKVTASVRLPKCALQTNEKHTHPQRLAGVSPADALLSQLQTDAATKSSSALAHSAAPEAAIAELAPTRLQPGMPRPLAVQWKRASELLTHFGPSVSYSLLCYTPALYPPDFVESLSLLKVTEDRLSFEWCIPWEEFRLRCGPAPSSRHEALRPPRPRPQLLQPAALPPDGVSVPYEIAGLPEGAPPALGALAEKLAQRRQRTLACQHLLLPVLPATHDLPADSATRTVALTIRQVRRRRPARPLLSSPWRPARAFPHFRFAPPCSVPFAALPTSHLSPLAHPSAPEPAALPHPPYPPTLAPRPLLTPLLRSTRVGRLARFSQLNSTAAGSLAERGGQRSHQPALWRVTLQPAAERRAARIHLPTVARPSAANRSLLCTRCRTSAFSIRCSPTATSEVPSRRAGRYRHHSAYPS